MSDERVPDFWSTCYRAKAELLRYRDRQLVKSLTSDARYDAAPLRARSEVTTIDCRMPRSPARSPDPLAPSRRAPSQNDGARFGR